MSLDVSDPQCSGFPPRWPLGPLTPSLPWLPTYSPFWWLPLFLTSSPQPFSHTLSSERSSLMETKRPFLKVFSVAHMSLGAQSKPVNPMS